MDIQLLTKQNTDMKAVFSFLVAMFISSILFAQGSVEQASISSSSPFAEHIQQFSWLYIAAFVLLVGVFVAFYLLGWDKKLFKAKTYDDGPQLFI